MTIPKEKTHGQTEDPVNWLAGSLKHTSSDLVYLIYHLFMNIPQKTTDLFLRIEIMEDWQELHINKHLPKLIQNTRCTVGLKASLMAAGLITVEEHQNLVSYSSKNATAQNSST